MIVIVDKQTQRESTLFAHEVTVALPSIVKVDIGSAQIRALRRSDDTLFIDSEGREAVVIRGFFTEVAGVKSELVLEGSGSQSWGAGS